MTSEQSDTSPNGGSVTYSTERALILTGVTTSCLARYERARLVAPVRVGRRRFYQAADLKRIRKAARLELDLGINLAGVEVILRLTDQLEEMQRRLARFETQGRNGSRRG